MTGRQVRPFAFLPGSLAVTATLGALLVWTGGAVGQTPSADSSDLDTIRALGLDSLAAGVTVYHSPGYRERAAAIGPMLYGALRFYADSLGVRTDFRLAVLDRDAWGRVSRHPYGLPYVSSRKGVSVAVLPADGAGAVYDAYRAYEERLPPRIRDRVERLGLTWGQAARQMVDLVGLHEVGHAIAYAFGARTPAKWLNEVTASYLADAYLSALRPGRATVWELMTDASLAVHRPRHHTLDDFERLYTAVGVSDYIWYQSAFAKRAGTLVEAYGFRFLKRLRKEQAATSHGELSNAEVLKTLESFAPGFQEWAAAFRDPGALQPRR